MKSELIVIGLTGGIASGKSLAARVLREKGIPVMDADALGHLVLEPDGAAYAEVVEAFGDGIFGVDGKTIDRQKLGKLVFDSPDRRRKLEEITHPAISRMAALGMEMIMEKGHRFAVYEAALLVETGLHESLSSVIVVSCSLANQLDRLCARDRIGREAAAVRIAAQYPLKEKLAVADHVLENDGTPEELVEKAAELADHLVTIYGGCEG